jgi:hypothetical protein
MMNAKTSETGTGRGDTLWTRCMPGLTYCPTRQAKPTATAR